MRLAGIDVSPHISSLLTTVLTLVRQPDPSTTVFRTRAGMIALGLADGYDDPQLHQLRRALIAGAIPEPLYGDLMGAVDFAEDQPRVCMNRHTGHCSCATGTR